MIELGLRKLSLIPQIDADAHALADSVRSEYVLNVSGIVRERAPGELLFNTDAAYQTELTDNTALSSEFRSLFSELDAKYTLSEDIEICERENDKHWLITDVENNRTYNILSEENGLNVYQGTVNPELVTGEIEVAVEISEHT